PWRQSEPRPRWPGLGCKRKSPRRLFSLLPPFVGGGAALRFRAAVKPLLGEFGDARNLNEVGQGVAVRFAILALLRFIAAINLDAVPGLPAGRVRPDGSLDAAALDFVDGFFLFSLVSHFRLLLESMPHLLPAIYITFSGELVCCVFQGDENAGRPRLGPLRAGPLPRRGSVCAPL